MTYSEIENFLLNLSFGILLFTLLFYWIRAGFFLPTNFQYIGKFSIFSSNITLIFLLVCRWIESHHFPLSNLYESLIFLTWSLTSFQILLEKFSKHTYIGLVTTPISVFVLGFASFSLPIEMQKSTPLIPALQSNWLMMHVTIMIISYAALLLGSLFSMVFLVLQSEGIRQTMTNAYSQNIYIEGDQKNSSQISENFARFIENLDNLSYRTLGVGFPLLTIGILSGAVWANETWGSYWSWDPKETWAFITWCVFAIYLHTRIVKKWSGKKPAIIATLGFFIVWICFLGVNIFAKGLHSYGWIT